MYAKLMTADDITRMLRSQESDFRDYAAMCHWTKLHDRIHHDAWDLHDIILTRVDLMDSRAFNQLSLAEYCEATSILPF